MSKRSYTLSDNEGIKKHKLLCGMRCYVSAFLHSDNSKKPKLITIQNLIRIVDKLSVSGRSVVLLNFHKSMHSAILVLTAPNTYSYVSSYADDVIFLDGFNKAEMLEELFAEEQLWEDKLNDSKVVYIGGLNRERMMNYVRKHASTNNFNLLSNNCSRFAADFLFAGCDAPMGKFRHARAWQMPANTFELAKEIDLFLQKKRL